MKIICTLGYISRHCKNWIAFCDKFGWDEYACSSGGETITQELTKEEAQELGLI